MIKCKFIQIIILDGGHCDAYPLTVSEGDADSIKMVVQGIEENIKKWVNNEWHDFEIES